jgi:hypothetical protein
MSTPRKSDVVKMAAGRSLNRTLFGQFDPSPNGSASLFKSMSGSQKAKTWPSSSNRPMDELSERRACPVDQHDRERRSTLWTLMERASDRGSVRGFFAFRDAGRKARGRTLRPHHHGEPAQQRTGSEFSAANGGLPSLCPEDRQSGGRSRRHEHADRGLAAS